MGDCRLCPKHPTLVECESADSCVFSYYFSSSNVEDLDTIVVYGDASSFQLSLQNCSRFDGYEVIAAKLKETFENRGPPEVLSFYPMLAGQTCLRCDTLGVVCYAPCIVSHYFSNFNELDLVLLSRIVEYEDMKEKLRTSTGMEAYNWIYEQQLKQVEANKSAAEAELRRWSKMDLVEPIPPIVKVQYLEIGSRDRPGMNFPIPNVGDPNRLYFVLDEGIYYSFSFTFLVDTVDKFQKPHIKYTNTFWQAGVKVDIDEQVYIVAAGNHTVQLRSTCFSSVGFYSGLAQFVDVDSKVMYLSMEYTFLVNHVEE